MTAPAHVKPRRITPGQPSPKDPGPVVMQLGGALGVALIGIVFYGAISPPTGSAVHTMGHRYTSSSFLFIAIAAMVMLGIRLLPRRSH